MRCTKCLNNKDYACFPKCAKKKNGASSWCKDCTNEENKSYRRTKKGMIYRIYNRQVELSRKRNMDLPSYSKQWLLEFSESNSIFNELYIKWVDSGYIERLKPSIDRKDDYMSYTKENIQFMTWEENNIKGKTDRREGRNNKINKEVIATSICGIHKKIFFSMAEASRQTGIDSRRISDCYNLKIESYKGWSFKRKQDV